ncbi:MAG: beta-ACP synthase, partial [Candidatus Dormibacteraeota bacterium]|nr:beta-ACP synthase [Candidatus Dormibacteraeota bacterium]
MSQGNGRVRVAITGMGAVTPLGLDVASTWRSAREGKPGISRI